MKKYSPEDFYFVDGDALKRDIADTANEIDEQRWACPDGGDHMPEGKLLIGDEFPSTNCRKCGLVVRVRGETIPYLPAKPK